MSLKISKRYIITPLATSFPNYFKRIWIFISIPRNGPRKNGVFEICVNLHRWETLSTFYHYRHYRGLFISWKSTENPQRKLNVCVHVPYEIVNCKQLDVLFLFFKNDILHFTQISLRLIISLSFTRPVCPLLNKENAEICGLYVTVSSNTYGGCSVDLAQTLPCRSLSRWRWLVKRIRITNCCLTTRRRHKTMLESNQ